MLDLQKQTLLWMVPTDKGKMANKGSTAGGLISMLCGMVILAIFVVKTEQMVSGQNDQFSSTLNLLDLSNPLDFNSLKFMPVIEISETFDRMFEVHGLRNEIGEWVQGEIEKYVRFLLTTEFYDVKSQGLITDNFNLFSFHICSQKDFEAVINDPQRNYYKELGLDP